jgi:hypothetical protein
MTERALSVRIADFARGAARIHATLDDPAVPADLASSIAVIDGLTTMPGHHPNGLTAPSPATPQSVATAYNAYGFYGLSAKGQTVAIYSESNFVPSDVQNFLSYSGLPASLYSNVSTVTIPSNVSVGLTSSTGQAEVTNDIDTILGFAPGASVVVVMNDTSAGNTYSQVYNALFEAAQGSSRMGGIVSQSWTSCEVNNSSAIGIQNTVDSLVETASMSARRCSSRAATLATPATPSASCSSIRTPHTRTASRTSSSRPTCRMSCPSVAPHSTQRRPAAMPTAPRSGLRRPAAST